MSTEKEKSKKNKVKEEKEAVNIAPHSWHHITNILTLMKNRSDAIFRKSVQEVEKEDLISCLTLAVI